MLRRIVIILLGISLLSLIIFALPHGILFFVEKKLQQVPCLLGEEGYQAPNEQFYKAQQMLDFAVGFPWTEEQARTRTLEITLSCMNSFTSGCNIIRDDAIYTTRQRVNMVSEERLDLQNVDWRSDIDPALQETFCSDWSEWIHWIGEHDLDLESTNACSVCPDPS